MVGIGQKAREYQDGRYFGEFRRLYLNGANVEPAPVPQFKHEYQKCNCQAVEDIRKGIKKFKGNDHGKDHDNKPEQCPDNLLFINVTGQAQIPIVAGTVYGSNAHTNAQAYCREEAAVEVATNEERKIHNYLEK